MIEESTNSNLPFTYLSIPNLPISDSPFTIYHFSH